MTSGFKPLSRSTIALMRVAGIQGSTAWMSVNIPILRGAAVLGQPALATVQFLTTRLNPGSIAKASAAPEIPAAAVAALKVRKRRREIISGHYGLDFNALWAALRQFLGIDDNISEELGIDVPTGKNDRDGASFWVECAGKDRRKPDRTARLNNELQFAIGIGHSFAHVAIADGNATRETVLVHREGQFSGLADKKCVADRAVGALILLTRSLQQRAPVIVEALWLDAIDGSFRETMLDGERNSSR